jgi:hypothetical protein
MSHAPAPVSEYEATLLLDSGVLGFHVAQKPLLVFKAIEK